jgi:NAD(P)-dependent dehydrogenase (short-subunit alcohol dehydrogenase family)
VRLDGKGAFVTGAAKGIGAAIAVELAERGAQTVLVDADEAAGKQRADEIGGTFISADVSQAEDVARAVAQAAEVLPSFNILINSAGIQRYGTVVETDEALWDEVIGVNLKAMYLTARYALPHIIAAGGGAIVNVASVQAFAAQRGVAAYSASKGGVVALTRAIAIDHAPLVRANCICPGSVDTPMLRWAADKFGEGDPDGTVERWGRMHPMGRVAEPSEIAKAAAFLASDDASFITGAALLVDGGLISIIGGT